jgi:tungstate transport system ATP-binding protein
MASAAAVFPLEARGVGVRFGDTVALRDVNLVLQDFTRIAVLGANGAGKSVLLRALHGLIRPNYGTVTWAGSPMRARDQAMVFQRPVMLRRTALENVEYGLAVNGVDGAERKTRARDAIRRVGLDYLADRQARVLSGGEQQRLALARAWALRPRLLFLDEPTANLDPSASAEIERVIGEIQGSGTAIVLATHMLGLAQRVALEVAFLHEGRVVERSPSGMFFTRPRTEEAARFLKGELPWTSPTS